MATNEIQNGCGLSIEAVLASNHKRRCVYTSHQAKIAEHGGDHLEDRNVPILVEWRGAFGGTAVTAPVETTQIAPTILQLLGLDPDELRAVQYRGHLAAARGYYR